MSGLKLFFSDGERPELLQVEFSHPRFQSPRVSVRGKTGGALNTSCTFQWTTAVQAFSILIVRTVLGAMSGEHAGVLEGVAGSPAASLDYSLSKKTNWVLDMFGVDSDGAPLAFHLFRRTNSERKRPGPVVIAINSSILPSGQIALVRGEKTLHSPDDLARLHAGIASQWGENGWHQEPLTAAPTDAPSLRTQQAISQPSHEIASFFRKFPSFLRASHSGRRLLDRHFSAVAAGPPFPDAVSSSERRGAISEIFCSEARHGLRSSNIFTTAGLSGAASRIQGQDWFPRNVNLQSLFNRSLSTSSRLSLQPEDRFPHLDALKEPLQFLLCPTFSGTLSILNYLRFFKGHPVSVDYSHATAYDILSRVSKNSNSAAPTAIVLTSGGAAALMKQREEQAFIPLMPLPPISHRVCVARDALKAGSPWTHGEFQFWSGSPSGSLSYFNILQKKGLVRQKLCTLSHAEPDESAAQLAQGDPDIRVIQWFPFPNLYELFLGTKSVDTFTNDCYACELVLFLDARTYHDEELRRDIENAIRGAWLDLMEHQDILAGCLALLCDDPSFLRTIVRLAGVDRLSELGGSLSSKPPSAANE